MSAMEWPTCLVRRVFSVMGKLLPASVCFVAVEAYCAELPEDELQAIPGASYAIERAQQRFFDYWADARTLSLSHTARMAEGDAMAVTSNPAGLAFASRNSGVLGYNYNQIGAKDLYSEYQHVGTAAAALPLPELHGRRNGIGFAWNGLQGGPRDEPVNSENRLHSAVLGYGLEIQNGLSLGYSLGWSRNEIYSNLYDFSMDNGFRHTLAMQLRSVKSETGQTTLGVQALIGHGQYSAHIDDGFVGDSHVRQVGASLGVGHEWRAAVGEGPGGLGFSVYGAFDYNDYSAESDAAIDNPIISVGGDETGHAFSPAIGLEIHVGSWLQLRGGARRTYRRHFFAREDLARYRDDASYSAWSTGFGLLLAGSAGPRLDFAFEDRKYGTGNHELSVSLFWPLKSA